MFKRKLIILTLFIIIAFMGDLWAISQPIKQPCGIPNSLEWRVTKHVSSPLNGDGAGGSHGDITDGARYNIFKVTGNVAIQTVWAVINTVVDDAASASTLEVGVVGNTATIASQIQADTLLADEIWTAGDSYAWSTSGVNLASVRWYIIANSANIVETTGTADVESGQIDYYVVWAPLEAGASVASLGTITDITP